jgi:hypothetical protein
LVTPRNIWESAFVWIESFRLILREDSEVAG